MIYSYSIFISTLKGCMKIVNELNIEILKSILRLKRRIQFLSTKNIDAWLCFNEFN